MVGIIIFIVFMYIVLSFTMLLWQINLRPIEVKSKFMRTFLVVFSFVFSPLYIIVLLAIYIFLLLKQVIEGIAEYINK